MPTPFRANPRRGSPLPPRAPRPGARACSPGRHWAEAVASELEREPADVVAADFELVGALIAAEAAHVPWRPTSGIPPRGSGDWPEPTPRAIARDEIGRARWTEIQVAQGLPSVNRARAQAGLAPLRAPFEQYDLAERVLVLTPAAFDFAADHLPANVRYVGTPFDDAGAPAWDSSWPADDARPLVVASLSTLQQGQGPILKRVCAALGHLPVRALVTLGPALDSAGFIAPPNVLLETFVPHAAVLPRAAAMVTQCGLGTTMKALAHGVPLVCIPLLGDQPDNAARVVARGAGVRPARDATEEQLRGAIHQVLTDPRFREGARRFASALAIEDGTQTAAEELEALAGQRHLPEPPVG